jgi:hypothetical protein
LAEWTWTDLLLLYVTELGWFGELPDYLISVCLVVYALALGEWPGYYQYPSAAQMAMPTTGYYAYSMPGQMQMQPGMAMTMPQATVV